MPLEAPYGSTHLEEFKRASESSQPLLALAHLAEVIDQMRAEIDELKAAQEEPKEAPAKAPRAKKAAATEKEAVVEE